MAMSHQLINKQQEMDHRAIELTTLIFVVLIFLFMIELYRRVLNLIDHYAPDGTMGSTLDMRSFLASTAKGDQ